MLAYFVSDVHLIDSADSRTAAFLEFLETVKREQATHLFLVGDIFDLWIADHEYFRAKFADVSERIRELVRLGVEVHYFEGNHDLHLTSFWQRELGVIVHGEFGVFRLGHRIVRVEHGDQMNPDDRGYLFLRWFLRTGFMRFMSHHLPGFAVSAIGERASRASRKYTSNTRNLPYDKIREMIRLHAKKLSRENKFDLLISGHVHVTDDYVFDRDGIQVRSVNLGAWFDGAKAFRLGDREADFVLLKQF